MRIASITAAALTGVATLSLLAAGCGSDASDSSAASTGEAARARTAPPAVPPSPASAIRPAAEARPAAETRPAAERRRREPRATGTRIKLQNSQFGKVLFAGRGQAVYYFDKEKTKRPQCYGACAAAWPPVITNGKPRAGKGIKKSLLGVTQRRDGRWQVTYAGHPLYLYANEGPNIVTCHDVYGFGGLWLAARANGRPVPH
jgi:predicted lipoprotein with Yx(FWY)xxD motif